MKKILIAFLFFGSLSYGQTKGISYQALIIDPVVQELPGFNNTQVPLANRNICLKFSFIDELNSLEYEEIFTTTTDDVGMVNLIIGTEDRTGGYASSFEDITWSSLPKNLKVDLSVNDGCSNFIEISNAPFTAVPFALFALNTENTPLVLDNEAEIILLKSLLATTQLGAGLNTDGTYSPNASSNFITGATSLNNADTILDGQVKNNKDVITDNTTSIGTNTTGIVTNLTAIGDNTINITTNTSGIATNLTTITDNTTNIGTNTTGIATNTNAITDNTTSIGTNTTGIATNTTAITDNTTNITTNTSGIATNTNAITDNTTSIGTNTTGIADNTIAINERVKIVDIVDDLTTGGTMLPLSAEQGKVLKNLVDTTVNILVEDDLTSTSTTNALSANQGRELKGITDTNSTDIATNVTDIATNTSGIATNVTDIATNTSGIATNVTDIATNTSGIATNVTDIATNTSGIATNVTDIATNTSGIATNVTDIATNTSGIATNVTDIATNTSGIATNVTDIATNTSGIATNVTDIATNTSGIATNVTDIATNVTDIATNTSGIATNVTDIATNTSGIATNVTDIATNTSGIATNVTDIATNTSGIATNVTDIATNNSGITTNVTDIATNTSGIATNVTDITTNTSGIATNVTDIATNTSGIATNVTDIATNTSGIATNVTDIATNTSGIATNVTDITTNTSGIATNVTDIATNTSGIATNVTDIATNTSGIATNVTDIATNTSGIATNVTDIATNTSGIATNVTDIATNTSGITTNVTDIATNTSGIATNVTDIATNTSGIATNVTDIATNTSGIATNVTDIATNTSGIATNVTDIATNTSGIATNVTDIATNTSGIATNVTDIATNTSGIATNVTDITTNTSGIATNVTDIATNTSGIATNVTDIATNTSGIATNVTDIATNTSGIATNLTDIATNTSGIATNVTDIATNTSGIATNVTDIATNISGIATNVTDIATNTSGIATNETDIATNSSGIATNVTDIATNTSGIATNVTDIATKITGNNAITAGTNTKITYDTKGLVTAGSAATTADIDASTDRNYVTDAEATVIGNTSGTNTGDQTLSGLGGVAGNSAITAGTNTKITYDAKGLVTAGSAATTADIDASTDRNYVTDAQATVVIGNTSGTNTGDQTAAQVVSTATGAIVATNVDSAIAELEAKKLALAGGEMTGNITMNGTETVDGRDLSVDGAKLDGIAAGAQVNVSGDSGNAAVYDNSGTPTLKSGITKTEIQTLINVEDGADVTDATNVLAAGALMDSEVTDLAGVKAVTISTLQVKPSEGAFADGDKTKLDGIAAGAQVNVSGDSGNAAVYDNSGTPTLKSGITKTEIQTLINVEDGADVTDATNVLAAGALMDSEVTDLAGVKAVTISTLQVKPSEGAFADGDKTKLDGIAAGAQVNVSGDSGNAAVYDNSGTPTLKSGITKTEIQTLINVEDGADVTDATNVLAAGALMDSEVTDLAGVKAVTISTLQVKPSEGAFADGDKTKLDGIAAGAQVNVSGDSGNAAVYDNSGTPTLKSGITKTEIQTLINVEDGADVTDATNVLAAGALMDSEVTDLAGVKAVTISTLQVKPSEGAFADGDKTKLDGIAAGAQVNVSGDSGNAAVYDNSGTPTLKSGITKTEIQTLINVEDGADVTDATNVLAAGALMDSEVTDLAGVKAVTISTLQVKPSEGAFADGDKTKLDGIAAGAQVNVSGDSGNAAVYDNSGTPTLKSGITKTEIQTLINVEDGADVTDATNVLAAGALMDSEVTDLAGVKAVTISTLQVKPSEGAFADGDKTKLDGIAAGAQVNVSGDSGNAAVYDNSGTPTLKSGITKTEIQTLINVEDGADVTDATNVLAAGALMDSEVTDLAGVKAVTISTLQVKPSEGAFADGDKTKLDGIAAGAQVNVSGDSGNAAVYDNSGTPTLKSGITKTEIQTLINVEDGADVTDATNVLAAGALMTTGDQTIADSKTFSSTIVGDINGNAATATKIASITNSDIVQLTETQTLTNKTLTSPTITGTGAIAGTFTGDITGDVTGNADTVTDNRPTSDALADISAVGSEYNSTSNIGSGEREFVTGFGITFNTFEAGIDISTESVVMIIPIEPAYSTVSSIDLPMQLIVTIDATNAANDTFTLNTWNGGGFSAPNVNFKFKFLVFK